MIFSEATSEKKVATRAAQNASPVALHHASDARQRTTNFLCQLFLARKNSRAKVNE
jgi:hypothetical protein